MAAPRRTITMIARVNRMRRRSSGILTVFKNAETIDYVLPVNRKALALLRLLLLCRGFRRRLLFRCGLLRLWLFGRFRHFRGRRGLLSVTWTLNGLLPQSHRAAGLLDFFPR